MTITSVSTGSISASDWLVIAVCIEMDRATYSTGWVNSLTVDGSPVTIVAQSPINENLTTAQTHTVIGYITGITASTVTVVVGYADGGTQYRGSAASYKLSSSGTTAVLDSDYSYTNTSGTKTLTTDVQNGGVVIYQAMLADETTTDTWSGLTTENYNIAHPENNASLSGGVYNATSTGSYSASVTIGGSDTTENSVVAASFKSTSPGVQYASGIFSLQAVYSAFVATGGTITEADGYRIHTFTASGNFTVLLGSTTVEYLVVAGGGGGGSNHGGGGGGAGGYSSGSITATQQTYSIVIGGGGAATANGTNSSAFGITSTGGGAGGSENGNASSGGSGGGGAGGASQRAGASGTSGQGTSGGTGNNGGGGGSYGSGGGGGGASQAGAAGGTGNPSTGGKGGDGSEWPTGSGVYYAGGGGGGTWDTSSPFNLGGAGGLGGGGNGAQGNNPATAQDGATNTGGGGGGSQGNASFDRTGKAGGSGIVIIRYRI